MTTPISPENVPCQCEEALTHLQEFIDCEMSRVDTERLAEHINGCATCKVEMGLEQKLRTLLRRSCMEQAPVHLRERVLTQITMVAAQVTIERG